MTRLDATILASTRYESAPNEEMLLDAKHPERVTRRAMLLFFWSRWSEARRCSVARKAFEARLPSPVGMSEAVVTIRREMISLGIKIRREMISLGIKRPPR